MLNDQSQKYLKFGFQDELSFNVGQKYCRMLQGEHSALFLNFIKLPLNFVIKIIFIFFEWPLNTGFTVYYKTGKFISKSQQANDTTADGTDGLAT